ncbi:MAG: PEP-CTERM sorting domain-containing protein [Opitutales bacterium]|nr:PEP-CTERM sorting domain-containing protein [Opitutales bacterium]
MKKYITIAALLAAGTAFANAETSTPITWETLRACNATFFGSEQTEVGESLTLSSTERVQFDVGSLGIDFAKGVYEFSFAVSDLAVGNGPIIVWGLGSGETIEAQKYGFGVSTTHATWAATTNGGSMAQREIDVMSYAATGLNPNPSISGVFDIKIGTFDYGTENAKYGLAVVFVDSSKNTYTLTPAGGLDMGAIGESCTISSVTLGGWASTSLSGCTMTVTSVPEPSAFGMLAGLGALVLVASRRRRR